ncbi:MAG TPA: histidine phosphatase family protein [Pseudonocardiaceae bacterium]|jgi:probable phosphoglycerate mutase|nr:histidine phosphatase family protein [Pseudonocardiaceae bacterium]
MSSRRLVLARHGQTSSNVRMALDSLPPGPPLTEEGLRQADELAKALAEEAVVAVYASTAIRAQQTARPVAGLHGLDVEVVEGIQEVFVGDLENRSDPDSVRQFLAVFTGWAAGDLDVPMPGGETGTEVIARYHRVLADIGARHPAGTVVVVSHGAVIRLVAPTLAGNVSLALAERQLLPNTGRVVLAEDSSTPTGWRCIEWTGIELS